jgi:hypothetical protein
MAADTGLLLRGMTPIPEAALNAQGSRARPILGARCHSRSRTALS